VALACIPTYALAWRKPWTHWSATRASETNPSRHQSYAMAIHVTHSFLHYRKNRRARTLLLRSCLKRVGSHFELRLLDIDA
jgi:hypothetical protein